jgi:Mce-associated membrane protein
MKLNPTPEIDCGDAKLDDGADLDEVDTDDTTDESAAEKPAAGLPKGLRIFVPTISAATIRTARRAASGTRRGMRALLARWGLITVIVAVVAAIAVPSVVFFLQYRPNQQTDDVAAHAAIKAASDGTVALLSYSPETIENDVAAGKSHLTGELLRYFTGFSERFVTPAVRQQGVKASATVLHAAVADMHPNSAVVLVFVHQTTTTKQKPDPVVSSNSVRVTLTKINGSWLITKFEPE